MLIRHLKEDYVKMEVTKQTYLEDFTRRTDDRIVEKMRKIIQAQEKNIRASYDESTEWIPSEHFVELILQDSVFIMELFLKVKGVEHHSYDKIVDDRFYSIVIGDLILLENQLPYFIFHGLFSLSMEEVYLSQPHEQFILGFFGLKIEGKINFKHFTDMFRYVYEESLENTPREIRMNPIRWLPITEMRNADNLSQAGVNFKVKTFRILFLFKISIWIR